MGRLVTGFIVLAIVLGGYYLVNSQSSLNSPRQQDDLIEISGSAEESLDETTYTLAEIGEHGSAEDCWLAIDGMVYDATEFIPSHPGGDALLAGCGTDATELFETRPMGSGTSHSESAKEILSTLFIGDLVDKGPEEVGEPSL